MNGVGGMEVGEGRAFISGVIDGLRLAQIPNCVRWSANVNIGKLLLRGSSNEKTETRRNERTDTLVPRTTTRMTKWPCDTSYGCCQRGLPSPTRRTGSRVRGRLTPGFSNICDTSICSHTMTSLAELYRSHWDHTAVALVTSHIGPKPAALRQAFFTNEEPCIRNVSSGPRTPDNVL